MRGRVIRTGIIGYGYWGPNLARNVVECEGASLSTICDLKEDRLAVARRRHPGIHTTTRARDVFKDPTIDAIMIATPVSTHFKLAQGALVAGKHLWVEKPLTTSWKEAERLVHLQERTKRVCMVDHVLLFTGAVRSIKQFMQAGKLGKVFYFDAVRVNLGLFQHDVNVIWDLASHDVAVMDYLLDKRPTWVTATGACHAGNGMENIAYITLHFREDTIAHFQANWLAPVKVRQVLIGGSKRMIILNDLDPNEKVRVYDRGVHFRQRGNHRHQKHFVEYRMGDMYAPKIDHTEALTRACEHFFTCIRTRRRPIADFRSGSRVVRILEAAERSLDSRGKLVRI